MGPSSLLARSRIAARQQAHAQYLKDHRRCRCQFIRAARHPYDSQHHQGRDGQISASNEPGWGAVFWIKISPPCFSSVAIGLRCARIVQLACDIAGNVGISDCTIQLRRESRSRVRLLPPTRRDAGIGCSSAAPRLLCFDSRDQFSASAIQRIRCSGSRSASRLHSVARRSNSN